jgi:hypothetical protein
MDDAAVAAEPPLLALTCTLVRPLRASSWCCQAEKWCEKFGKFLSRERAADNLSDYYMFQDMTHLLQMIMFSGVAIPPPGMPLLGCYLAALLQLGVRSVASRWFAES